MTSLRNYYQRLVIEDPDSISGRIIVAVLWPIACLYGIIVWLRLLAYSTGLKRVYQASVPVVSVGNLTLGGTGKTPMTDYLAKWMVRHKVPVAIVSRGYGGHYSAPVLMVDLASSVKVTPAECGDEPFLLAKRNPAVPVFVARQKALGVRAAEKSGARLIVLDDGFQHRAVQRNLDIVLLDSRKPFGNGHLLPAGQLREPVSALQRSDLLVMTRSKSGGYPAAMAEKPILLSRHVMSQELETLAGDLASWQDLAGKKCLAFAGIARPDEFFRALQEQDLTLVDTVPLADHQVYDSKLIRRLTRASKNCDALITTQKDAVKLVGNEFPVPCYQAGVEMTFDNSLLLDELLQDLIAEDLK